MTIGHHCLRVQRLKSFESTVKAAEHVRDNSSAAIQGRHTKRKELTERSPPWRNTSSPGQETRQSAKQSYTPTTENKRAKLSHLIFLQLFLAKDRLGLSHDEVTRQLLKEGYTGTSERAAVQAANDRSMAQASKPTAWQKNETLSPPLELLPIKAFAMLASSSSLNFAAKIYNSPSLFFRTSIVVNMYVYVLLHAHIMPVNTS